MIGMVRQKGRVLAQSDILTTEPLLESTCFQTTIERYRVVTASNLPDTKVERKAKRR